MYAILNIYSLKYLAYYFSKKPDIFDKIKTYFVLFLLVWLEGPEAFAFTAKVVKTKIFH